MCLVVFFPGVLAWGALWLAFDLYTLSGVFCCSVGTSFILKRFLNFLIMDVQLLPFHQRDPSSLSRSLFPTLFFSRFLPPARVKRATFQGCALLNALEFCEGMSYGEVGENRS